MLKKIIISLIIILLSINIIFAGNKEKIKSIKELEIEIINSKYKKNIYKINNFLKKNKFSSIQKLNKKLKKIDFSKIINKDKKNILFYIKIKTNDKINEIINNQRNNYNGLDISKNLKFKHLQEMPLSCEISATSDILSYFLGKKITEKSLLKILNKSEFNKTVKRENGKNYWGNPNKGFVGYINKLPNGKKAKQGYMTGYGVLEKPIAKIYKQYGFETKIIINNNNDENYNKKNHLSLLLEELHKGNMVQIWGDICTNPKNYSGKETICKIRGKLSWSYKRELKWEYKNKNGKYQEYIGLNGEHAFYLLGYKGNYINPTHIMVWDTMTGKHTYPTKEWMRKWGKMQNRSIIIYKK